jgi:hypothetical protein
MNTAVSLQVNATKAARDAANAAKESADAAVASARAWIAVTNWNPPTSEKVNGGIGIWMQNVGKTPGLSLRLREEPHFLAAGEKEPTYTECPSSDPIPIGNTMQAGEHPRFISPLPLLKAQRLDPKQISALGHGARLILHGCVTYRNVVGPTNQPLGGLTEFCSIFYGGTDRYLTDGCASGNQMK